MQRPRAAIVVTGSELVRGERSDLNGPYLAQQALSLGLEPARITIVGDRPDGALSLGLAGTAPGFVLDAGTPVVVLPGPPPELQRLWPGALETGPVRRVLERARRPGRRVLRFFGASESAVAKALAEAGG